MADVDFGSKDKSTIFYLGLLRDWQDSKRWLILEKVIGQNISYLRNRELS